MISMSLKEVLLYLSHPLILFIFEYISDLTKEISKVCIWKVFPLLLDNISFLKDTFD